MTPKEEAQLLATYWPSDGSRVSAGHDDLLNAPSPRRREGHAESDCAFYPGHGGGHVSVISLDQLTRHSHSFGEVDEVRVVPIGKQHYPIEEIRRFMELPVIEMLNYLAHEQALEVGYRFGVDDLGVLEEVDVLPEFIFGIGGEHEPYSHEVVAAECVHERGNRMSGTAQVKRLVVGTCSIESGAGRTGCKKGRKNYRREHAHSRSSLVQVCGLMTQRRHKGRVNAGRVVDQSRWSYRLRPHREIKPSVTRW